MTFFTLNNSIILGLILFSIGAYGVLTKRNLLVMLMSLEIMFNAVNVVFAAFNYFKYHEVGKELGQYFILLVVALAAAEAAIGLAILLTIHRNRGRVDSEDLTEMKG